MGQPKSKVQLWVLGMPCWVLKDLPSIAIIERGVSILLLFNSFFATKYYNLQTDAPVRQDVTMMGQKNLQILRTLHVNGSFRPSSPILPGSPSRPLLPRSPKIPRLPAVPTTPGVP